MGNLARLATFLAVGLATGARADDPLRLLIVDGQNNHDWRATTPLMKDVLEGSGRFTVEVATAPPNPLFPDGKERYAANPDQYTADMAAFRPPFERFDVILLNYNGYPWPEETHAALEAAVREGGKGLVVVHAADNAFPGRPEYDRMIGLGWRPKADGPRLEIDAAGRVTTVPAGQGPDSGHGKRRTFPVVVRNPEHPIMAGMPGTWMHARDELYHGLRGPAEGLTLLATAYDDPADGGTGAHEPVAWTVGYGQGRVFHTPLGHDREAMRCVGFITLLVRGSEWAATGKVTVPIPDDFPTADTVRTRGGWWEDVRERAGPAVRRYWPFAAVAVVIGVLWLRLRRRRRPGEPGA